MRRVATGLLLLFCVVGIGFWGKSVEAAYYPDQEFLQKIQKLLVTAPVMMIGDMPLRHLQVGEPYREGDVAYFTATPYESRMQLEEWRIVSEGKYKGNFRVSFWVCWSERVKTWSVILSLEGQLMNDFEFGNPEDGFNERDIPIHSSEAIAKSEKIQKLLRKLF